jgi:hypothetical protein
LLTHLRHDLPGASRGGALTVRSGMIAVGFRALGVLIGKLGAALY